MAFLSDIEAVSATRIVQWGRAIDGKRCVVDVVFLAEFRDERVGRTLVLIGLGFACSSSLVSGLRAAYSQYCSSSGRITVSPTGA